MRFFPHISMATMTTCPGASLITKKTSWVEYARKFSFGAMSSHPKLNIYAKQEFSLPGSLIGAFEVLLFSAIMHGLSLYKHAENNLIKGDTDHSENLPSN